MPQGTEGFVRKLLSVRPTLALDFALSLEGPWRPEDGLAI
jgi:hypothetical protein